MRIVKFAGSVVAAAIVCCASTYAAETSSTITKLESRQLPPNIVTKLIFDQLSPILHLEPYPSGGPPPRLPLSDLWFRTVPYTTALSGLCADQEITVYFLPASSGPYDAATTTKPYRIEAKTYYRFVNTNSRAPIIDLELEAMVKANAVCRKLNPETDFTMHADNEDTALEAIQVVDELSEQASQKKFSYGLECGEYGPDCRRDLEKISSSKITDVARCEPIPIDNMSAECWNVVFLEAALELRIYAQRNGSSWILQRVIPDMIVSTADARAD